MSKKDDDLNVKFWAAARDAIDRVRADPKADGAVDLAKLYADGCTQNL